MCDLPPQHAQGYGVHLSPTSGDLRIDATAHAITGLLRFLSSGAEKN